MVFIACDNKRTDDILTSKMFVIKRDGRKEPVMFDKITSRIQKLCYGLNMDYIDPPQITMEVINGLYSGVSTVELDNLAAEKAVKMSNEYPDYGVLAARIEMSNLHKETKKNFSEVMDDLYNWTIEEKNKVPKMDKVFYEIIQKNADILNSSIIYDRDFSFTYFSIKMLEKNYLKKIKECVVERPQHMFMRVAVAIHREDIEAAIETYNLLSEMFFTVSPMMLRNAGFTNCQMFDTYSLSIKGDSIDGIYDSLEECATVARSGGAIGFNVHCIRSMGSYIAGTNGTSNGLTPMLRVFNSLASFTHLGGEKVISPITIYLEVWHADILEFVTLKRPTGTEEQRAKNLSYALWIPDLFMKRTESDGDWAVMCPNDSEQLQNLWGKEFEEKYTKFENEGRYVKVVKARKLWSSLIQSQIETGSPVMLYKDTINRKSNLQHLGVLHGGGYQGEILPYTSSTNSPGSASSLLCLHMFVKQDKTFDFNKLKECVKVVTQALNKAIDANDYPTTDTKNGTLLQRPLAIGVQGFATALLLMRYPYESPEAKLLNKQIFETIYYGALEASCELAEKYSPCEAYQGSPMSKGKLHFDLCDVTPSTLHDWTPLRSRIAKYGVRNAVFIAFSTSDTLACLHNCNVGTEPLNYNTRNMLVNGSSYMQVINHHLVKDLIGLGIWDDTLEELVRVSGGFLQGIDVISDHIKKLYKTAWSVSQREVLQMAADRSPFVDQSQSINIRIADPNYGKITSMHFYGWSQGLKTGMSNLDCKVFMPQSMTNRAEELKKEMASKPYSDRNGVSQAKILEENEKAMVCSLENKDECLMCGS